MSCEDEMILVKINKLVNEIGKENITPDDLLSISCCAWTLNLDRAKKYRYVGAVFDNQIIAVFEVKKWIFCCEGKVRFIGGYADLAIRNKYLGKDVEKLFPNRVVVRYPNLIEE